MSERPGIRDPAGCEPLNLAALMRPEAYRHPVGSVRLVETHISWVLLTGAWAYKIKKPLRLDFLDYSTPERRRHACLEELRLNRRFAPGLYAGVVPVAGTPAQPVLDGEGAAFDYAVKMREFPQQAQLDRLLESGTLGDADMDALAVSLAAFHDAAPRAGSDLPHGRPAAVRAATHDTLVPLRGAPDRATRDAAWSLMKWVDGQERALEPLIARRRREGRVREVHGDLHLANLVRTSAGIVAFDCIEFSEPLRWIDVISDLAFATMDLRFRGRRDLANRLLNRYLECTGDYEGVRLLRYYEVYRALVRAEVAAIRAGEVGAAAGALHERDAYLAWARERSAHVGAPLLVLMHGVTGSGKSWLSERLAPRLSAVRVRSDVERRRVHGLSRSQPSGSGLDAGLYSAAASARTYARLVELARALLRAGEHAIVDAAFLRRSDRQSFQRLARELGARFAIVTCSAPVLELERRIAARGRSDVSEGSVAVLARQLTRADALDEAEARYALAASDPDATAGRLLALPEC